MGSPACTCVTTIKVSLLLVLFIGSTEEEGWLLVLKEEILIRETCGALYMTNGEAWIVLAQDYVVNVSSFIYSLICITHPFPVLKHHVKLLTFNNANHFQSALFK